MLVLWLGMFKSQRGSGLSVSALMIGLILAWALVLRAWFAWRDPQPGRFYDERFAVANPAHTLTTGELLPIAGYYPSLSYLPHLLPLMAVEAVGRWRGEPGLAVALPERDDLTAAGYRTVRLVQVLFGVLSIALVFRVGRRLFGPSEALLAALLLAAVPWHLRQSAAFKPDIVMIACALLAFDAALGAERSGRWRSWLWAGATLGLTLSAKPNGLVIAAPLALVAGLDLLPAAGPAAPRKGPAGSLARLLAAGAVALATFLALNPAVLLKPELFQRDMGQTRRVYEGWGRAAGTGHLDILVAAPRWLAHEVFHGPLIGGLALLALAVLLATGRPSPRALRERWLLVSFPLVYPFAYAVYTTNPRAWHNYLVLTPFTSLAAAWLMVAAWRRLRLRLPARHRRWSTVAAGVAVSAAIVVPAQEIAFTWTVPSTAEAASAGIAERFRGRAPRVVIAEADLPAFDIRFSGHQAGVLAVDSILRPGATDGDQQGSEQVTLALADALIFPAGRLRGPERAQYQKLLDAATSFERIVPRWLRLRGTALCIVHQPWQRVGKPKPLILRDLGDHVLGARIPPRYTRFSLSLVIWVSRSRPVPTIVLGGHRWPILWGGQSRIAHRFLTPRLRLEQDRTELRIQAPGLKSQDVGVELYRWRPVVEPRSLRRSVGLEQNRLEPFFAGLDQE